MITNKYIYSPSQIPIWEEYFFKVKLCRTVKKAKLFEKIAFPKSEFGNEENMDD
jgi:hypothetical protein